MTQLSILVVEDDKPSLDVLTRALQNLGHRVIGTELGTTALDMAQRSRPDLAILDIGLPGMNGIEVARRLRELQDLPIIFLTAYSEEDFIRSAVEQGAFAYMIKPLVIAQLKPAIDTAISRAAELRKHRTAEANLAVALAAGRATSVAIGLIMERFGLTEDEAFAKLRNVARSKRKKVAEVAEEIVRAIDTVNYFLDEKPKQN